MEKFYRQLKILCIYFGALVVAGIVEQFILAITLMMNIILLKYEFLF